MDALWQQPSFRGRDHQRFHQYAGRPSSSHCQGVFWGILKNCPVAKFRRPRPWSCVHRHARLEHIHTSGRNLRDHRSYVHWRPKWCLSGCACRHRQGHPIRLRLGEPKLSSEKLPRHKDPIPDFAQRRVLDQPWKFRSSFFLFSHFFLLFSACLLSYQERSRHIAIKSQMEAG